MNEKFPQNLYIPFKCVSGCACVYVDEILNSKFRLTYMFPYFGNTKKNKTDFN